VKIAKRELRIFLWIVGVFLFAYLVPFSHSAVRNALFEAFAMLQEYAQQHVLLCLVPAFFIAFLYSGPAINILAIILTARILGVAFGLARAIGAVLFSVVIGLVMHLLFRREETDKLQAAMAMPDETEARPLWKTAVYVAVMIAILVFANWGKPGSIEIHTTSGDTIGATRAGETGSSLLYKPIGGSDNVVSIAKVQVEGVSYASSVYTSIYRAHFYIAGAFLILLLALLRLWFTRPEIKEWGGSSWSYAKLILPYLFGGVLVAGFLLGRPGHQALIPADWISRSVGGNSWLLNGVASVAGAFMYFATLTEIPILQGLQGAGMGDGLALALLLAGPALSLPNMLVIRKVLGTKKTLAYIILVCIAATLTGKLFGTVMGGRCFRRTKDCCLPIKRKECKVANGCDCCCNGSLTLIFPCSGGSDVGEVADRVAKAYTRREREDVLPCRDRWACQRHRQDD